MTKCAAQQKLRKWLETFSTCLEIYSLDIEVKLEADLNELKQFRNELFKSVKEKQMFKRNDSRTVMITFVILGKTTTSGEKTVVWIS